MTGPGAKPNASATPMIASWTPEQLQIINPAVELQLAVTRPHQTQRRWVPIWVVCVDDRVFVRTWYRRTTGWFGHALDSRRARIRVPGLEADVAVEDLGEAPADLLDDIDAAYRNKYRRHGHTTIAAMTSDEARTTTLQLNPTMREVSRNDGVAPVGEPLGEG